MHKNSYPEHPTAAHIIAGSLEQYRPDYALDEMVEETNECSVFALKTGTGEETTNVAWCIQPGGFYEPTEVTPGTGFSFTVEALEGKGVVFVKRGGTEEPEAINIGRSINGEIGLQRVVQIRAGDTFGFYNAADQADGKPLVMFDTGNMPFEESYERPVGPTEPTNRLASAVITLSGVELPEGASLLKK